MTEHFLKNNILELKLEGFEGPIDLLLSLVKDQKVDILKIKIFPLAEPFIYEFLEPKPEMVISDLKRNPFLGDLNHIHHLLKLKLNYIKTLLIILALTLFPVIGTFLNIEIYLIIIIQLISYIATIIYAKLY